MATNNDQITIADLLSVHGVDREAKAYAFLYAAFKRTEISNSPVKDAIDCLIPFIAPHLISMKGKQIDLVELQGYINTNLPFDFPLYAIEQLMPELQKQGYVEYNKVIQRYVAKSNQGDDFSVAKEEIETHLDKASGLLELHAAALGLTKAPVSETWEAALLNFLKSKPQKGEGKLITLKGSMLASGEVESRAVASFISNVSTSDPEIFRYIVNIFMGVLVEEFISSIAEVSVITPQNPLYVMYDTSVILRLLGCSGRLHETAVKELTESLKALGARLYYFPGNETEVNNILEAIIYTKDSGGELEGETAEAISMGEVSVTDIRMLRNTFPERLAAMGVFSTDSLTNDLAAGERHQISEAGLSAYLLDQANFRGKRYSVQNRTNDAGYIGNIVRMRRGIRTKDLAECRYIFLTSNKLLATASRRFLVQEKQMAPQHCPPAMHLGQMATIAWLLQDHHMAPEKAGRELLANCYAAVRPDAEWFKNFREHIEKHVVSMEEFTKDQKGALTLQAARRIAQDESFGNSALVRQMNTAELLNRAQEAADRAIIQLGELAIADKLNAVALAEQRAREEVLAEIARGHRETAVRRASLFVQVIKVVIIGLFCWLSYKGWTLRDDPRSVVTIILINSVLFVFSLGGLLDLIGLAQPRMWFERLRRVIAKHYLKVFNSL